MALYYALKSEIVEAEQVNHNNIYDLAKWCAGVVYAGHSINNIPGETEPARIGDWILRHENGSFSVRSNSSFHEHFLELT